jgi:hypothetical protein
VEGTQAGGLQGPVAWGYPPLAAVQCSAVQCAPFPPLQVIKTPFVAILGREVAAQAPPSCQQVISSTPGLTK